MASVLLKETPFDALMKQDANKMTVLMYACLCNVPPTELSFCDAIIEDLCNLLSRESDARKKRELFRFMNATDEEGRSALTMAAISGRVSAIELLTKVRVEVRVEDGDTKVLDTKVLDVNVVDNCGFTPLMYAVMRGSHQAIDILKQAGAVDVPADAKGLGYSVLHVAAERGDVATLELLVRKHNSNPVVPAKGPTWPVRSAARS